MQHIDFYPDSLDQPNSLSSITAIGPADPISKGGESFFSKKKKRLILLWFGLFSLIIFIAFKFLLNLSFVTFFSKLSSVSSNSYFFATVIFGFFTFVVCELIVRSMVIKEKLEHKIKQVTKFEWAGFAMISFLIQSVTPFSLGSEPYIIWWLNKKGISFKEAGAVVAVTSFCWFVGQFFITWPSFIFLTVQNWEKIVNLTVPKTYWFVVVGLIVDMIVALFIFAISYVRQVHYFVSKLTNNVRKYFGLSHSTHDEIIQKYLKENTFQRAYVHALWQFSTLKVVVWYLINNLWLYLLFVCIFRLFQPNSNMISTTYHIINVATTANNFVPLPSAEGSLQLVIKDLLSGMDTSTLADASNSVSGSNINVSQDMDAIYESTIFLWRFFYKYLGLIVSFLFVCMYGFNSGNNLISKIKKYRQRFQTEVEIIF